MSRSLVGSSITRTFAGSREEARQQQAVALAAGQRLHRRVRALRRKQEVAEVGHHVPALPPISTQSDPGLMVSATTLSGSSCSRSWSK